jgi:glycerol-3-phosphate acyltransferase PlsY
VLLDLEEQSIMKILLNIGMLVLAYLIGSTPFGLIIVKAITGKDVRSVESGRTGGTNVMRAAGFWAGLSTAILDVLKGAVVVWLARLLPGKNAWIEVLSPVAAILGHNYSIYLAERDENGRLRLRGGAGGATCLGGSFGLWMPSVLCILPLAGLIFYFIGYASVTTMSVAFLSTLVFVITACMGITPWQYALYGIISGLLLIWTLRPNIKRLVQGNERIVGFRARKQQKSISLNYSSSSSSNS